MSLMPQAMQRNYNTVPKFESLVQAKLSFWAVAVKHHPWYMEKAFDSFELHTYACDKYKPQLAQLLVRYAMNMNTTSFMYPQLDVATPYPCRNFPKGAHWYVLPD